MLLLTACSQPDVIDSFVVFRPYPKLIFFLSCVDSAALNRLLVCIYQRGNMSSLFFYPLPHGTTQGASWVNSDHNVALMLHRKSVGLYFRAPK